MLAKRLLVAIVLIPIGVGFIAAGGAPFALFIALIAAVAGWEYVRLFQRGGFYPSLAIVVVGSAALVLARAFFDSQYLPALLSLLVLIAMTYHLVTYECGRDQAATDFGITLGGVLYIGWLATYLVSLRWMPEGKWWLLTAFPAVWASDAFAMFVGKRLGRHPLSLRLSPNKTWEGYLGGIFFGTLMGGAMGALWHLVSVPVTFERGLLLGLVVSSFTILGDLGESMIKRQVNAKDSSNLLPGHGGVLDRIDTWLWTGVLAYYIILAFG